MGTPPPRRPAQPLGAEPALPERLRETVARPPAGRPGRLAAAGYRWGTLTWGRDADPPLLLIHGVTADGGIWWRVAPALAAAGRHVVAVDLPGHGRTGGWRGRHRFAETAEDLAGFIRLAALDRPELAVVGHSWGAMVAAHLPAAGVRPGCLVLFEPPSRTLAELAGLAADEEQQAHATRAEAFAALRSLNPAWTDGDVEACAAGLVRVDVAAARAIVLGNGDWDAGLAALDDPAAAGIDVWLIRGDPAAGGLLRNSAVRALVARLGAEHVITLAGAPHSPQRTHPAATVAAILLAVSGAGPGGPAER
jgi:pimeloyl-ACP methyl ester carboxylesterase